MKRLKFLLGATFMATMVANPAHATLISVTGPSSLAGGLAAIISPPPDVNDGAAFNIAQQGFDEVQNFLLPVNINVDGGVIASGTVINSHMIFLNNSAAVGNQLNTHTGVQWTLDGEILGVMSDFTGSEEIATSSFLGALGTAYPVATFNARGMESDDSYSFLLNVITVNMRIRQPGDWIRVITASSQQCTRGCDVPEPMSMMLVGTGLLAAIGARRSKFRKQ